MLFEAVAVVLGITVVYTWVLNKRVAALPANARRGHAWLKDEELKLP
ncbi:hypothetical protein ACFLQ2_00015 [archaeon]